MAVVLNTVATALQTPQKRPMICQVFNLRDDVFGPLYFQPRPHDLVVETFDVAYQKIWGVPASKVVREGA